MARDVIRDTRISAANSLAFGPSMARRGQRHLCTSAEKGRGRAKGRRRTSPRPSLTGGRAAPTPRGSGEVGRGESAAANFGQLGRCGCGLALYQWEFTPPVRVHEGPRYDKVRSPVRARDKDIYSEAFLTSDDLGVTLLNPT